jgi:uncharacterized protein (DUF362 family)
VNPRVVGGIIEYLKSKDIEDVTVGEGPVGRDIERIYRISGYRKLCGKYGVKLINLDDVERTRVGGLELPRVSLESEYINVAKLKTHIQTTVTLGLKNQKGLLKLSDKRGFHKNLHENIARLGTLIKPDLTVIDALNGVEGNGPGSMGWKVGGINLVIAGRDVVSVDSEAARLIGVNPEDVKHIKLAADKGVGKIDDDIVKPRDIRCLNFKLPSDHHSTFNAHYFWDERTCSGCSNMMSEVKGRALSNPAYMLKLFLNGVLGRIDFITGKINKLPKDHGKVICIGECTRELAEKYNLIYVPGCPPKAEDVLKKL